MDTFYPIFRISFYRHHTREDNSALVAAEGPLEAQKSLEDTIHYLSKNPPHLMDNYELGGRIDPTGAAAIKPGVIFMTYPAQLSPVGLTPANFSMIQAFHGSYLKREVSVFDLPPELRF